jgi:hypothetical protein
MNRRTLLLMGLGAGGLSLVRRTSAAEVAPRRSALRGIAALDRRVTYTETKIPLVHLVQKVADDTGTRLAAAPGVAREPVCVVVKDLSARELLEQLAELLDYRWLRQSDRSARSGESGKARAGDAAPAVPAASFIIQQDLAGRQREENLRHAALADVEKRLREQVRGYAQMAMLPPIELQRQAEEYDRWREWFFKLPYSQRMLLGPGERGKEERLGRAQKLSSPVNRSLAQIVGRLSAAQWSALRAGQKLTFSSDPQPGELLLPVSMMQAFRTARPPMQTGWGFSDAAIREEEQQRQRDREVQWAAATGYRVTVSMDSRHLHRMGLLTLLARAAPLKGGAAFEPNDRGEPEGTSLGLVAGPVDLRDRTPKRTPAEQQALENDPVLGLKKLLKPLPEKRPRDPMFDRGWSIRRMLPSVAHGFGVSFIADAYAADIHRFGFPGQEPISLHAFLDRYAGEVYRWDRRGSLIRLRKDDWFFSRSREATMPDSDFDV